MVESRAVVELEVVVVEAVFMDLGEGSGVEGVIFIGDGRAGGVRVMVLGGGGISCGVGWGKACLAPDKFSDTFKLIEYKRKENA